MKTKKYSKIPEVTPTKGSLFDSSSSTSAVSSRQVSPIPQIPKKIKQKSSSFGVKLLKFFFIIIVAFFVLVFASFTEQLTVWAKGCGDDLKEYNLFCIDEDKYDEISTFCQNVLNNNLTTVDDLLNNEKEMIQYCPLFEDNGIYYKMATNRTHLIFVIIGLFLSLLLSALVMIQL